MNPGRFSRAYAALWSRLRSLKLTLVTLFLLAGGSVLGTLLPQNLPLVEYHQRLGPVAARIIQMLQLYDMYHSWWFMGLLGLFAVNLAACSIHRLPGVWRQVATPDLTPTTRRLQNRSLCCAWQESHSFEDVAQRLATVMDRRFARVQRSEKNGTVWLFAHRQAWSRLGAYATHLAILIILLGGVVGAIGGFRGYVTIAEGQTVNHITLFSPQRSHSLGFDVRCDQFSIDYYENSGRPREFRSLLTILESGREVSELTRVPVRVNHPLHYRGVTFFQSGYDMDAELLRFSVTPRGGGKPFELMIVQGQSVFLPDGTAVTLVGYIPDIYGQGAAAGLSLLYSEGTIGRAMAFQNPDQFSGDSKAPYAFRLISVEPCRYTGLQVSHDPGVPIVWFGCLLLVIGTLAAFYFSHQRLWVQLQSENGVTHVLFAGHAHRRQEAFAQRFDKLCNELQSDIPEEKQ